MTDYSRLAAPNPDMGPMAELIGWCVRARDDGEPINAQELLDLVVETRRRMLAPINEWLKAMGTGGLA